MNVGAQADTQALRAARITLTLRESVDDIDDLVTRDYIRDSRDRRHDYARSLGVIHNRNPEHVPKMIEHLMIIRKYFHPDVEAVEPDDVRRVYELAFSDIPEFKGVALADRWKLQRIARCVIAKLFTHDETKQPEIRRTLEELGCFAAIKQHFLETHWIKAIAWYVYRNKARAEEMLASPVVEGITEQLRLLNDGTPGEIDMLPALRGIAFLARELCHSAPESEESRAKLQGVLVELARIYTRGDVKTQQRIIQAFHASLFLGEAGLSVIAETGIVRLLRDDTEAFNHPLTEEILKFARGVCVRVPVDYRRLMIEHGMWNIVWRVFVPMDGRPGLDYSTPKELLLGSECVLYLAEVDPEVFMRDGNMEVLCRLVCEVPYNASVHLADTFLLIVALAPTTVLRDLLQKELFATTATNILSHHEAESTRFMSAAMKQLVQMCCLDTSLITGIFGDIDSTTLLDQLAEIADSDPALQDTIQTIRDEIQNHTQ